MRYDINELRTLARLFNQVYQETKNSVLPQLPLELAIIEYGEEKETSETEETKAPYESGVSVSSLRKQEGNIKKIKAMYGSANLPAGRQGSDSSAGQDVAKTSVSGNLLHTSATGALSEEWLGTFWKNIISEMKNYNHTIAGVLRGASLGSFDKKTLVIETGFKFHKERLSDIKTKTELSRVAKMLTGKDVTVEVQLRK